MTMPRIKGEAAAKWDRSSEDVTAKEEERVAMERRVVANAEAAAAGAEISDLPGTATRIISELRIKMEEMDERMKQKEADMKKKDEEHASALAEKEKEVMEQREEKKRALLEKEKEIEGLRRRLPRVPKEEEE